MKTIFTVEGPRDVPVYAGKGGRTITDENVQSFWGDNDDLGDRKGCYIFGIRAGVSGHRDPRDSGRLLWRLRIWSGDPALDPSSSFSGPLRGVRGEPGKLWMSCGSERVGA